MTKKERRALQDFMNQESELTKERDRIFKELQDMSRAAGMVVYCCAESNAKQLTELGDKRANWLYENYLRACAQLDLLMNYGSMLAELNFWK